MKNTPQLPQAQELPTIPLEALKAMSHQPAAPTNAQMQALTRLVRIAQGDTGQSRCVAKFLLAWWNAGACGGFDLTSLWSVDLDIAEDMQAVFGLIANNHRYPDAISPALHDEFVAIAQQWRTENL